MSRESNLRNEVTTILTDSLIGGRLRDVPEVAIDLGVRALLTAEETVEYFVDPKLEVEFFNLEQGKNGE